MASPAPKSPEQSDKSKKYDRQLRLSIYIYYFYYEYIFFHIVKLSQHILRFIEVMFSSVLFDLFVTRLWGDHGQAALESSQVCLINANGLGTEILKSLVLPGIGAFTIVDGKKITEEDIGCKYVTTNYCESSALLLFIKPFISFFLDVDSCGKSRAQVATQLLLELNPDVRGDYVDEDVEQLLENSADFFNCFTVVIGSSLSERYI